VRQSSLFENSSVSVCLGGMAANVDFTLTFFDACVIISICKANSRQKMWS